jgi:AAA15 family ATPase/GTPase
MRLTNDLSTTPQFMSTQFQKNNIQSIITTYTDITSLEGESRWEEEWLRDLDDGTRSILTDDDDGVETYRDDMCSTGEQVLCISSNSST